MSKRMYYVPVAISDNPAWSSASKEMDAIRSYQTKSGKTIKNKFLHVSKLTLKNNPGLLNKKDVVKMFGLHFNIDNISDPKRQAKIERKIRAANEKKRIRHEEQNMYGNPHSTKMHLDKPELPE